MKYEEPATGIMKNAQFEDSIYYTVECSCGNPDDELTFVVEVEDGDIMVNTYVKVKSPWWKGLVKENRSPMFNSPWLYSIDAAVRKLINGIAHRINITYEVWTKGYVSTSSNIILNKQQTFNYAHTLIKAIEILENGKKDDI